MYRHQEDLVNEEETYRMLQEIVRSPELIKAISGSSLKGVADPKWDKLQPDDKQALERIEMLEKKGFDVENLKNNLKKRIADKNPELADVNFWN